MVPVVNKLTIVPRVNQLQCHVRLDTIGLDRSVLFVRVLAMGTVLVVLYWHVLP